MTDPAQDNPFASPQTAPIQMPLVTNSGDLDLSQFKTVRTGLGMIYYSLLGILFFAITLVLVGAINSYYSSLPIDTSATAGIFCVVMLLLTFIGACLCLKVPKETGAKGFFTGAVGSTLSLIPYLTLVPFYNNFNNSQLVTNGALFLTYLIPFASFALFTLALRKIAIFIGNERLIKKGTTLLVLLLMNFGIHLGMILTMLLRFQNISNGTSAPTPNMLAQGISSGILFGGLGFLFSVVIFVKGLNLVGYLRKALKHNP